MRKLSIEEFKDRSNNTHNIFYDYAKSKYTNSQTKICITCPTHGDFYQLPNDHMRGVGCRKCYDNNRQVKSIATTLRDFKKIHGERYDYSKVIYTSSKSKVNIICKIHGEFWQRPNDHMSGSGCPKCKSSSGENEVYNYLKENKINFESQKIFDGLISTKGNSLYFDFYIQDLNACIEFDGKQHYEPIEYFGGLSKFYKNNKHDILKYRFCNNNNIKLIRIPYYANITQVLKSHGI